MDALKFDLKLKEVPVSITDVGGREHAYVLRELTGLQRQIYNDSLDIDMTLVDGKPQIKTGEEFKIPSDIDLLAMCLYDENDKAVSRDVLGKYPTTVLTALHKVAFSLSGLDKKAEDEAKNVSEVKDSIGTD